MHNLNNYTFQISRNQVQSTSIEIEAKNHAEAINLLFDFIHSGDCVEELEWSEPTTEKGDELEIRLEEIDSHFNSITGGLIAKLSPREIEHLLLNREKMFRVISRFNELKAIAPNDDWLHDTFDQALLPTRSRANGNIREHLDAFNDQVAFLRTEISEFDYDLQIEDLAEIGEHVNQIYADVCDIVGDAFQIMKLATALEAICDYRPEELAVLGQVTTSRL